MKSKTGTKEKSNNAYMVTITLTDERQKILSVYAASLDISLSTLLSQELNKGAGLLSDYLIKELAERIYVEKDMDEQFYDGWKG